jgi:DNA-binding NtrC family response regulator
MLFGQVGLVAGSTVGALFLRDIDKLARELQDRLNDWLDGGAGVRPRLIASCCADPAEAVRSGRLLESLYCALGTLVISVPALRERLADLPALASRMLQRLQSDPGVKPPTLAPGAIEVLSAYLWPGNLRALFAVLQRAQGSVGGERVNVQDLPLALRLAAGLERAPSTPRPVSLDALLEQVERRLISLALRRAGGNKSRAAEYLTIWRARLLRRMEALGLNDPPNSTPS